MSELKVVGTIKQILPVENGTSKSGKEWKKQSFVIDTNAEYNPEICFQLFGEEKIHNLSKYNKVGDSVEVSFNISSREYNGKYYHNLDAWMIKKIEVSNVDKLVEPIDLNPVNEGDLPF